MAARPERGSGPAGMAGRPYRLVPDGLELQVRLTPGGRDGPDGVGRRADGRRVLLARVRAAAVERVAGWCNRTRASRA